MRSPRSTLAVSFASLFVVGILSGALGPFLPHLSRRAGVSLESLGTLFTALFLGALAMQVFGGWLIERVGLRNLVVVGTGLLALGILGITVSPSLPAILLCAVLAGAGQGTLDVSTNVLVAAVYEERAVVSAVNLLHFAFGAGAVVSPLLASAALAAWGSPMPVLWLAVGLGVLNTFAICRWALDAAPTREGEARPEPASAIYTRPALWLLSLILFLYVGVEMGVGGWTTVYAGRTTDLAPGAVAMLTSGYWLALTAGRLLGTFLGVRTPSRALATISITGTCLGSAMLAVGSGSVFWTVAGTIVTGVSFGPIFPTVVVMGTELFRAAPGRAVSVIISVSSLGGMVLPPLQGVLLERVSPAASVALVAAACLGMLLLLLGVKQGVQEVAPSPTTRG